jgi:hypothetical protein
MAGVALLKGVYGRMNLLAKRSPEQAIWRAEPGEYSYVLSSLVVLVLLSDSTHIF